MFLMSSGNEFQSTGVATLNDLAANVLHVVLGISSLCEDQNLRPGLVGFNSTIKSLRYWGPVPLRHLCVSTRILKFIHCHIGNQWSWYMHSLGLSYLPFLNVNFAHMFCTR